MSTLSFVFSNMNDDAAAHFGEGLNAPRVDRQKRGADALADEMHNV